MALKLYERYPQLWESPSNDYPQGAFKNLSAQGETDGSYLEKDWLNDYSGFFGALLRNAQMTPDGTIDTAQRSQFYDALIKVAKSAVADQGYATTSYVDSEIEKIGISNLVTKDTITSELGESTELVASQKLVNDTRTNINNDINALQRLIFDAVPVGVIKAYIGETAPNDKWLLCRGQAFSAESYPNLAQLLPDLKIPDLRGVALRGLDANRGFDPDRALLSYQEDAMQKISGGLSIKNSDSPSDSSIGAVFGTGPFSHQSTALSPIGVGASYLKTLPKGTPYNIDFDTSKVTRTNTQNETVMKNVAVNFIIKAK